MRSIQFDKAQFRVEGTEAWLMLRIPPDARMPARALVKEMKPDKLYETDVKPHKEKRSLDANAYFWLLCGKMAAVTGIPKNELYQEYIKEIGDNFDIVPVREDAFSRWVKNWQSKGLGWLCEDLGPSKANGYRNVACYYGSSCYDTAQMSRLIDLVVYDCKEQDIETATPEELARLKEEWNAPKDKSL